MRLVASVGMAADHYMGSFENVWGSDVLAGCHADERHVMKSMARQPVRVLVERLPAAYCTVEEPELDKLIHDVQNVLLNIQLRSEVIARRRGEAAPRPPDPLPGRETPAHQRLAANFCHFRWWAEHLTGDGDGLPGN